MSRSKDLEGVHGAIRVLDFECACQAAGSARFQPNNGVLRRKMRWPFVFRVFFHCLWV